MLDLTEEILKSMRASPVILGALIGGLDDEQIRTRPAPGEWAVIEVAAHVANVDERAHARLRRMLAEDNPFLPAFDRDALAVQAATSAWICPGSLPGTGYHAPRTSPTSPGSTRASGSGPGAMRLPGT